MVLRISVLIFFTLFFQALVAQLPAAELERIKKGLAENSNDTARYRIFFELSQGYRFSNIDSAIFYVDKAIATGRNLRDGYLESEALSQKGFILLETGDIPQSLQFQLAAYELSKKNRNKETEAFALNRIGNVYVELGDYHKAIRYYRDAVALFTSIGQIGYVHNEYSNIGNAYEKLDLLDSAQYYHQKVFDFSLNNTDRYAITYAEMRERFGRLEARMGNDSAAIMHFRAGIREAGRDADMNNLSLNYIGLATLFDKNDKKDSALIYARQALETAQRISLKKAVAGVAPLLMKLYASAGQMDSALMYSELSVRINDSLYGKKNIQDLQRILLTEHERQANFEKEKVQIKSRYRSAGLLILLVIFLIIGIFLFRNNRSKQKANLVLERTLNNLRATQAQLIQKEKMASLGELTAGIAHEIQNPLNFVNNFSELTTELIEETSISRQKAAENNTEVNELLSQINGNLFKINHHGKRAEAIVKGMLLHSHNNSGEKQLTDLNTLTEEYLRMAYNGMNARNKNFKARVITSFDDTIGKVNVVPQDLARVLLNLYNNAFYAVDQKAKNDYDDYAPEVRVSTKNLGDKVEIKVEDNGTGIPKKISQKIFQPFFTTKPTGHGTGLGLSLAYDIVTKGHDGEISFVSEENGGTTFRVIVPRQV